MSSENVIHLSAGSAIEFSRLPMIVSGDEILYRMAKAVRDARNEKASLSVKVSIMSSVNQVEEVLVIIQKE